MNPFWCIDATRDPRDQLRRLNGNGIEEVARLRRQGVEAVQMVGTAIEKGSAVGRKTTRQRQTATATANGSGDSKRWGSNRAPGLIAGEKTAAAETKDETRGQHRGGSPNGGDGR